MTFGLMFVLNDKNDAVPCDDVLTWSRWANSDRGKRTVAETISGESIVKTTFLGINCQVRDGGPPLLFNSEVFHREDHRKSERSLASRFYSTYDEALSGHRALVKSFANVSVLKGASDG